MGQDGILRQWKRAAYNYSRNTNQMLSERSPDAKECILYNAIYMSLKTTQSQRNSVVRSQNTNYPAWSTWVSGVSVSSVSSE